MVAMAKGLPSMNLVSPGAASSSTPSARAGKTSSKANSSGAAKIAVCKALYEVERTRIVWPFALLCLQAALTASSTAVAAKHSDSEDASGDSSSDDDDDDKMRVYSLRRLHLDVLEGLSGRAIASALRKC